MADPTAEELQTQLIEAIKRKAALSSEVDADRLTLDKVLKALGDQNRTVNGLFDQLCQLFAENPTTPINPNLPDGEPTGSLKAGDLSPDNSIWVWDGATLTGANLGELKAWITGRRAPHAGTRYITTIAKDGRTPVAPDDLMPEHFTGPKGVAYTDQVVTSLDPETSATSTIALALPSQYGELIDAMWLTRAGAILDPRNLRANFLPRLGATQTELTVSGVDCFVYAFRSNLAKNLLPYGFRLRQEAELYREAY